MKWDIKKDCSKGIYFIINIPLQINYFSSSNLFNPRVMVFRLIVSQLLCQVDLQLKHIKKVILLYLETSLMNKTSYNSLHSSKLNDNRKYNYIK